MKSKICLNMIVKDESAVILRSLFSVLPLIDYWVIVDTGSKDDTPKIVETFFREKGIPGELHHRMWVDFATNRNQALQLAKSHGDYLLFVDADEEFVYEKGFKLPFLKEESYFILCSSNGVLNHRKLLVRSNVDWKWVDPIHETLEGGEKPPTATLKKLVNYSRSGGARSRNLKATRENDAKVLENKLKKDPKNSRAQFYLALTYFSLQKFDMALKFFRKRAWQKDFSEERYLAQLMVAKLLEGLKEDASVVFDAYLQAIKIRPERVETYFYLSRFLRKEKDLQTAYEVAKKGMELPMTHDLQMVESKIYEYGMALEYSVAAVGANHAEEAREVVLKLLRLPHLPVNIRSFVETYWKAPV